MDKISKSHRSWNMSRIKSRDTRIEMVVRKFLYKNGFRYRVNNKIYGNPDIVFLKRKIAVFVDGCFWHYHNCKHFKLPKTNSDFWEIKLKKNIQRDRNVVLKLEAEGWTVKRIWECELEKNPEKALNNLKIFLNKNGKK
jgi:DNA mismatch endonuclease (patch repair protein)